jgi:MinD superfamily P-loop ATPase
MKEITILSGKGGTGKTSITAALASLAQNTVFCDNDVDAADLHLILKPQVRHKHIFKGARIATIDENSCTGCGLCKSLCRFDAIKSSPNGKYIVNPFACEGCRLCERECPVSAITSSQSTKNYWFISDTRFGKMVHAHMKPGEENSGKLVALVRNEAKKVATEMAAEYILNDGPPGIGCSAISSITGADHVLLVIEPTQSGFHDARRLKELVETFGIEMSAVINKSDLAPELTFAIAGWLETESIPLLAKIPFDEQFVHSMIETKTIVEYSPDSPVSKQISAIWNHISKVKQ